MKYLRFEVVQPIGEPARVLNHGEGQLTAGEKVDVPAGGYVSVQLADGRWLVVSVSEWGDVRIQDHPTEGLQ